MQNDYEDFLMTFSNVIRNQKMAMKAWLGGSLANHVYDKYSNVNLYIQVESGTHNLFIENLKNNMDIYNYNIKKISNSESLLEMYYYPSDLWVYTIIFDGEGKKYKKEDKLLLLNESMVTNHFRDTQTPFRLIDDWNLERDQVREHVRDNLDSCLLELKAIAIAIGRSDPIFFQKSLTSLKNEILTLYILTEKNGHHIDCSRIEPYLHPFIKKLAEKWYIFTDFDEVNDYSFRKNMNDLLSIFNMCLYRYERVLGSFEPNKLKIIERFWVKIVGWKISLSPNKDQALNVYTQNLADDYDNARPIVTEMVAGLHILGEEFLNEKDVLELGPGTGRISLNIIPHVKKYTGIEQSPYMIDKFRKKITDEMNVDLINGDTMILESELPDKTFDVIFEHEVMLFTLQPTIVVNQIINKLNPGGLFIRLVKKRKVNSIYDELLDEFHRTIYEFQQEPFIVKGVNTDNKITLYLHRKKIRTTKKLLSSWTDQFTLEDFIGMLEMRPFPYLEKVNKDAIKKGSNAVKKYVLENDRLNQLDFFEDDVELFCFISQKPKGSI